MRLKLDEHLPHDAVRVLADSGHDVQTVHGQGLGGRHDDDVVAACGREQRALVTLDMGFANILMYPPSTLPGLIVLRLSRHAYAPIMATMKTVAPLLTSESVAGRLWIVEESRVRIR